MNRTRFSKHGAEPRWDSGVCRLGRKIPPQVRHWLLDQGSLTARLKTRCTDEGFRVRLLAQGWGRPLPSEARVLRSRHGMVMLVREVELLCHGQPWVFARTLIPATSLHGPARRLARLRERPLGQVLFSDPRVRRGATEFARLAPGHPLFAVAVSGLAQSPPEIWGRRTLFFLANRPLLVNELFLPGNFQGEA